MRAYVWIPPSTSMKINTCLGSQHLHGGWVADDAGFRGSAMINRSVYRRYLNFLGHDEFPPPPTPPQYICFPLRIVKSA
jgi:hypothetical protein